MANRFNDTINDVEHAPKGQRADALINGIAQQMQQSGNQQTQQLGQELQQIKSQLVSALQQS